MFKTTKLTAMLGAVCAATYSALCASEKKDFLYV